MPLSLPVYDGHNLQFILDRLATSHVDTGGREIKLRYGTETLTYTASVTSASKTIAHGMGSTPLGVVFGNLSPLNTTTVFRLTALSSTQFSVSGYQADDTAITQTQAFFWLAVG